MQKKTKSRCTSALFFSLALIVITGKLQAVKYFAELTNASLFSFPPLLEVMSGGG